MKLAHWIFPGALALAAAASSANGQELVAGKVYVAEIAGGVSFAVAGNKSDLKKGESFPAQGARNQTAPASHVVFVYSNGTSLYVDEKTTVEIAKFMQKPFPKGTDTTVNEPSVSHTLGRITQGRIIITTNKLATGTTMQYVTPHAEVKVRGKEVVIEVEDRESRIYVVNGDVTVTPLNGPDRNLGQVLHTGQVATVTEGGAGDPALRLLAIDPAVLNSLSDRIAAAERAQQTVVFETVTGDNGPEIQANAVVPTDLPVRLTVSPATLRSGG